MKGRSIHFINALGAQHIERDSYSDEGFLNGIYVIFTLAIKLGKVAHNLTQVSTQAFDARSECEILLNSEHE